MEAKDKTNPTPQEINNTLNNSAAMNQLYTCYQPLLILTGLKLAALPLFLNPILYFYNKIAPHPILKGYFTF